MIITSNSRIERYLPPEPVIFKLQEPEQEFISVFKHIVSGFKMLPEYSQIISWLRDNKGKGLALIGANGRGKTIIGRYVIPILFQEHYGKHITRANAQDMNQRIDELLRKKFVSIDDIGTEDQRIVYGERRWTLPELVDNAEKNRNILILTSNLDADAIEKKYGLRTRERVRAVCKVVVFKGESLRK